MTDKSILEKTVKYIEDHLDQELNLDDISSKMGYSKFHLNREFSDTVGCTIYKYIQLRRITEAAKKLVESDESIIEIALEANYQSQQAFHYAFKQVYGCAPQVYRMTGVFLPRQVRYQNLHHERIHSGTSIQAKGGVAA